MSQFTDDQANTRAEARRRARLAARGELPPDDESEAAESPATSRGSFLTRLFPAAPPLPGRPDPLSGFDPSGPMRPIRERIFLLRQAPLVWIGFGVVAFVGYVALRYYQASALSLLGTFAQFGALIAAGWFGWRRPTLYGAAAGAVAFVLVTTLVTFSFISQGAPPTSVQTPLQVAISYSVEAAYQVGLGFLGGWYGGYLRRRQTQLSAEVRRRR